MQTIKLVLKALTRDERNALTIAFLAFFVALAAFAFVTVEGKSAYVPIAGGSYAEGVIGQPIMVNPVLSENQADKDVSALIYSPLFSLLDDWKVSDDGREYTVKLKEGLVWDDAKPLTSDDILFTVQTIQDPDARSPLAKDWQGITVERLSQLQVKFTLPTPYVFFTENLKRVKIIPKHIFGAIPIENVHLSEYNLEPVGNGPYKFEQYAKRKDGFITEYRLSVNEHYAGTRPYIDNFSFKFYATQDDLIKDFRLRRVNGFGSTLPLGSDIQELPRVTMEAVPMPRYYAIFMNAVNNPALKDANLRYALNAAINKEKIVAETFKGRGGVIESPVFKGLIKFEPQDALGTTTVPQWLGSATSSPAYDPVGAARTIAGLKTKDIKLTLVVPHMSFLEKAAELIKEDWIAAGISDVSIVTEEPNTIANDYVKPRNYELLLFGNIYENPADLFPFWHSSQRFYPGLNLSLYQNNEADRLMELIRQKNDAGIQEQSLMRLETVIQNDTPSVFLFTLPYFYAHTSQLAGFAPGKITAPEDRFKNVEQWSVAVVRVLK